jgi:hypothetical protein
MSSNERSKGLAKEPPVLHYDRPHDEHQVRMRQLANFFIEMFLAERASEQRCGVIR